MKLLPNFTSEYVNVNLEEPGDSYTNISDESPRRGYSSREYIEYFKQIQRVR